MWRKLIMLICLGGYCCAGPLAYQRKNMPIMAREDTATAAVSASSAEEMSNAQDVSAPESQVSASEMNAMVGTLTLPSNATSIRADITDNFSCENKTYGYYADVENDCQIFHVCLPVTYADGKENTFRWSFICPEETIFSQESFTCMRREDMTIDCEESFKFYELNRNFGMIEEDSNQHQHTATNNVVSEVQTPSETASEAMVEPKPIKVEQSAPQPTMEKPKPSKKVQKPIRRKPALSYTNQKKDAAVTVPIKTMPQVTPIKPAEEPVVLSTQTPAEVTAKPAPQRFNKRPTASVAVVANKEKPQAAKPEVPAPIRNDLFSQKRKRPSVINKKEVSTTPKTVTEAEKTEQTGNAQVQLSEPTPTLKLETMFSVKEKESVKPVEAQDAAAEASEPVVSIEKAETPIPVKTKKPILEEKPKEEVPAVEDKSEETQQTVKVPETIKSDALAPIEAIEEIPAVIIETEEEKPEEIMSVLTEKIEEPVKTEESANEQSLREGNAKPAELSENGNQPTIVGESLPDTPVAPAIMESTDSAEAFNNIAALEAAKPADAPESMPATPEMEQANPMIDEMLDNSDEKHHTVGGFKPVDPEMAAEAEQLISDFINTLRLNEQQAEQQHMVQAETIEPAGEQPAQVEQDTDGTKKKEEAFGAEEALVADSADAVSIEEAKLPEEAQPQIIDPNASVSVEEQISDASNDQPQKLKNVAPISNILMLNNLPADMYQIPVKVIETPEGELEMPASEAAEKATEQKNKETEQQSKQPEEPAPEENMPAFVPPISIDDIVELVKERLDQTPKGEHPKPMELVLTTNDNASGPAETLRVEVMKPEEAMETTAAEKTKPKTDEEKEEIIVPIYQRIAETEPLVIKTQTVQETANRPTAEQATQTETEPAQPAPAAPHKMDARKRRFLFHADAH